MAIGWTLRRAAPGRGRALRLRASRDYTSSRLLPVFFLLFFFFFFFFFFGKLERSPKALTATLGAANPSLLAGGPGTHRRVVISGELFSTRRWAAAAVSTHFARLIRSG